MFPICTHLFVESKRGLHKRCCCELRKEYHNHSNILPPTATKTTIPYNVVVNERSIRRTLQSNCSSLHLSSEFDHLSSSFETNAKRTFNSRRNSNFKMPAESKEEMRNEDSNGLPKIKTSLTEETSSNSVVTKRRSSLQPVTDNATKVVKQEQSESLPLVAANGEREDVHKLPVSASTRYSSRQTPMCSSPSQTADPSRANNLFSPQPQTSKVSRY